MPDPCRYLCGACGCYWCGRHEGHVHDCGCPPVEEWEGSPDVTDHPSFCASYRAEGTTPKAEWGEI